MSRRTEIISELISDADPAAETVDLIELWVKQANRAEVERYLDPEAEIQFATPDGGLVGGMSGPFRGPDGLYAGWREWTGLWSSMTMTPPMLLESGDDKVLALGTLRAVLGDGPPVETASAGLFTFEGDRIVRIEHFLDQDQARRAAGLDAG